MDHSKFNSITTLIFDVDGVFTNSEVLVNDDGSLLRKMNVRDGQAIKLAKKAGYNLAVLTKGASPGAKIRLTSLGIEDYYDQLTEKTSAFNHYIDKMGLKKDEILYMGDDVPDLAIFSRVSISCCPYDAANDVLPKADYISPKSGGNGCVRDVIERVMRIQGKWEF